MINKVQVIYWVSGNSLDTNNQSMFIDMPDSEMGETFIDNAMARFRSNPPDNWREVINIINHGKRMYDTECACLSCFG
jgi:hypothetical protein